MAINRDSTPPPKVGKIGPYTVFMTPPSTPKPPEQPPIFDSPKKVVLPPVQPPLQQFVKPVAADGSVLGFFKIAVTKVQNAHSSLDDHLARWFGLTQSKYQWALDDYYESKGSEKGNAKAQEQNAECITCFLYRIDCKRELVQTYFEYRSSLLFLLGLEILYFTYLFTYIWSSRNTAEYA